MDPLEFEPFEVRTMNGNKSQAFQYLRRVLPSPNDSSTFAGQAVGIKEVNDDIWLVSFMDYDLGYFDLWAANNRNGNAVEFSPREQIRPDR